MTPDENYALTDSFIVSNGAIPADQGERNIAAMRQLPHILVSFNPTMPEGMNEAGIRGLGVQIIGSPHFKNDREILAALHTALHVLTTALGET